MTEAPVKYKNATTKRVRKMTSVQTQETIKQRLNGEPVCLWYMKARTVTT